MKRKRNKQKQILLFALCFFAVGVAIFAISSTADKSIYVAPGKAAKAGEHKWAVIIGVNKYDHPNINDLSYAVADAEEIYKLLVHKDYGGFDPKTVDILTDNGKTKPTRENILKALRSIEKLADADDTVFIFFSGHGIEEEGISYFLPANADVAILADTSIPMERFTQTLNRTKAKVQVMFFDACHSGVRKDQAGSSGEFSKRQFSRIFEQAEGRAILASCNADEVSWEYPEKQHGVFTYYLLEGLSGEADQNGDGFVTVSEASNHVMEGVKTWSFKTKQTQNPRLMYNVSGEIVLTLSQAGDVIVVDPDPLDRQHPQITIASHTVSNGETVTLEMPSNGKLRISGQITDDIAIGRATVNDSQITLRGGRFNVTLPMKKAGSYPLRFRAWDTAGKEATFTFTIVIPHTSDIPPPPPKMVLIPAGEFQMGSNDSYDDEKPVHTVYVDAFYIDIYEVTNAQYRQFVRARGHREPKGQGYVDGRWQNGFEPWKDSRFNGDNQPVVCVSWHDAMTYAQWAGKRLPTEAEWEKEARGGLAGKKYPWGDSIDKSQANYDENIGKTTPVGKYTPNAYGLYDIGGNVWEWCLDEYVGNFYANSSNQNPVAGEEGLRQLNFISTNVKTARALRGGSWDDFAWHVRVADRLTFNPSYVDNFVGFRCARAVSP